MSATLWICTDCLVVHHYGNTAEGVPDDHGSRMVAYSGNAEWFAGLVADEHADDCENVEWGENGDAEWIGGTDCECETNEFSRSRCEGCGSTLGGSRHAVTMFETEESDEEMMYR